MRRTALLMTVFLVAGCTDHSAGAPTPSANPSGAPAAQPAVDYTKWAAGRSAPVADSLYPKHGNPGLDVLHYGLDLSWAPSTSTLTGTATLQIRPPIGSANIGRTERRPDPLRAAVDTGHRAALTALGDTDDAMTVAPD